jgi:putative MFS transporter
VHEEPKTAAHRALWRAVVICSLGYFIDIFDIQLFAILRVASLKELGVGPEQLPAISGRILNAQMGGMLIGAFLWGYLGDRFGRLKALYGSILLYSLGTLACGLVRDPVTYGLLRFATGFGLAGETGAATTLVAEMMTPRTRGWGVTAIAGVGLLGPVFAVGLSGILGWRTAYLVGGSLGLCLLAVRARLEETALFMKMKQGSSARGSLRLLAQPGQARKLLYCIMAGLPLIYAWSLLNFFSVEIGRAIVPPAIHFEQRTCLLSFFVGTSCGDLASGALSQLLQSRRKAIALFLALGVTVSLAYLLIGPRVGLSAAALYGIYFTLGTAAGCWVLVTTVAAEQFGTNIRATTAITAANLIRGCTLPMVFVFGELRLSTSINYAAAAIGAVLYALAFAALSRLPETHGVDLDYLV